MLMSPSPLSQPQPYTIATADSPSCSDIISQKRRQQKIHCLPSKQKSSDPYIHIYMIGCSECAIRSKPDDNVQVGSGLTQNRMLSARSHCSHQRNQRSQSVQRPVVLAAAKTNISHCSCYCSLKEMRHIVHVLAASKKNISYCSCSCSLK